MVTLITLNRPMMMSPPSLNLCFRYLELLDWMKIERKYGRIFPRIGEGSFMWQSVVTVSDILELTPPESSLLAECRVRSPSGKYTEFVSPESYFSSTKFVTTEHICYKLTPSIQTLIHFQAIQASLHYSRVFYELKLSKEVSWTEVTFPVITNRGLPRLSMAYASKFHKQKNIDYSLHLTFQNISVIKLGYPYEFFTCTKSFGDRDHCIEDCRMKLALQEFNRVPFDQFYQEPIDEKLIGHQQLLNESCSQLLDDQWSRCLNMCMIGPFRYSFYITSGNIGFRERSVIEINTPSTPNMNIQFVARLSLTDVTIYILSSLGIWFGFVVINCDPWIVIVSVSAFMKSKQIQTKPDKNVWTLYRSSMEVKPRHW